MFSQIQNLKNSFKKKSLIRALSKFETGELTLYTPEGDKFHFKGINPGAIATLHVHNWNLVSRTLRQGDIGFGESFMDEEWSSPDPIGLCILLLENVDHITKHYYGSKFYNFFSKVIHWLRPNTLKGSVKNISAHYDVGNEFYQLWLDETMSYSSAIFKNINENLADAQNNKYQRILDELRPSPQHILEIGCGWGRFAVLASQRGHRIDGITISKEQASFAQSRVTRYKQAQILFQDYRQVKHQYDAIVSIEMFEAVGEKYWPQYFCTLKENLKSGGRAIIQTITVKDENFEEYQSCVDFIQKHIFPGGMLPSAKIFNELATKAGLTVINAYEFGHSYCLTLKKWLENFDAKKEEIIKLGYSDEFIRKWQIYLAFCAANFATGRTQVYQFTLCHTHDVSVDDLPPPSQQSAA